MVAKKNASRKQKGGVAYTFNNSCRVGGLPERVAISQCPKAGPLDSCHMKQMYGQSCTQAGGKGKTMKKQMNKKSKKSNKKNMDKKKSMNKKKSMDKKKSMNKKKNMNRK